MQELEKRMTHWLPQAEGSSELVRVDPKLGPGEKRVIAVFQDESSFHANEYRQTVWCAC